jgi:hypothetical protein
MEQPGPPSGLGCCLACRLRQWFRISRLREHLAMNQHGRVKIAASGFLALDKIALHGCYTWKQAMETGHGGPHPNTFLALYSRQKSAYCYTTCIRKGRVGHECLLTNVRPYVHISVSSLGTYINRLPSNLIPNRADSMDCSSRCFSPKHSFVFGQKHRTCGGAPMLAASPYNIPRAVPDNQVPSRAKKNSKFTVPLTVV